ncbi:MAG: 4Fe-4S dicluster domain-containing protein [Bacillota bacterium]
MKLEVKPELCSGCRVCEVVCALKNMNECNPKKSTLRAVGHFPAPGRYEVKVCTQCGVCAEACPVGAIHNEDGVYRIHEDECIACMQCVSACPTGVMFTHPEVRTPFKCVACGECIRYCPTGALFDGIGQVKGGAAK